MPMPPAAPEGASLAPPAPTPHVATRPGERVHHVVISSLDRDWAGAHPLRCRYQARLDAVSRIKNVVRVEVECVVLPSEIRTSRQDTSTDLPDYRYRAAYDVPSSVSAPFLMVHAEELQGAYAGTNDAICRALACCTHARSCRDAFGRGYDTFKPADGSAREYRPPLASLPTLSLSFTRPNNVLLNAGTDGLLVRRFAYTNLRPSLVEVQMDAFFDRNQFYVGDYVIFAEFEGGGGGPAGAFALRPEGHQVFDMGVMNSDSYYRSFFVRAPGAFDPVEGAFVADADAVAALTEAPRSARVVNTSLQNTLFLRVTALEMTNPVTMDYTLN